MYKTKEQKIQAVADFKKQDLSVKEYAEKIGVHMSTMYNWIKLYGDEAEKIEESATVEEKLLQLAKKKTRGGRASK